MASNAVADQTPGQPPAERDETRKLAVGYARGFMGGMLVGVPAMLTMELWWEGFFVPAWRLVLLLVVNFGVLLILQHFSGLTHRKTIPAQVRAAVVAYGIGIVASVVALFALGVLHGDLRIRALGGAMLFGFAISGTEEPLLIAEQLTFGRAVALMLLSLFLVHAIVYAVDFKAAPKNAGSRAHKLAVLREGVSTYALSLLVGTCLLWTFRTLDSGMGIVAAVYAIIDIGFVTSLGAAAAELLI